MSLSQLLNIGKKAAAEETSEPPIPPSEPPLGVLPIPAGNQGGAVQADSEDLKLARYLVESQEKVLKEEAEKRAAEDELLAKEAIAKAAETAKLLAEQRRSIAGNSLSTGGGEPSVGSSRPVSTNDIHPGLEPEEWLNKHQIIETVRRQFLGLDRTLQKKIMQKGSLLFAQDQSAVLVSRIRNLMAELGAPTGGRNNMAVGKGGGGDAWGGCNAAAWNQLASCLQEWFRDWGSGGCGGKGCSGDWDDDWSAFGADTGGCGGSSSLGGGGCAGSSCKGWNGSEGSSGGGSNGGRGGVTILSSPPCGSSSGGKGGGGSGKGAGVTILSSPPGAKGTGSAASAGSANGYGPAKGNTGLQSESQRASPLSGKGQQRPTWGW